MDKGRLVVWMAFLGMALSTGIMGLLISKAINRVISILQDCAVH